MADHPGMALDIAQTAGQLYAAAGPMRRQRAGQLDALATAVRHLESADPLDVEARRASGKFTWLAAGVDGGLAGSFDAPPLAVDHVVVAVDGSHIDVDRHSPARCSLVNIGGVALRYGEQPDAELWSAPTLCADEASLALRDPLGPREVPIEGALLGMTRAVMEIEALAEAVERCPEGLPVLALLDGALVLWGLSGDAYPDFVRDEIIDRRLVAALDRLRAESERRPLAVASHISLPRSSEVVGAVRISREVCRWETVNCDANCGRLERGNRNCDIVAGVTDADLFAATLRPGERSPLFRSDSKIVRERYGPHQVAFFYVHLGEEVARIETLAWAGPEAIGLAHAGLLAQAEMGHGYPLALQEAHEQAVISGADRQLFDRLVYETLASEDLPTPTSQKARSKRTRFV